MVHSLVDLAVLDCAGDIFYRLNAVQITVPALRERTEDIPELVHHFLDQQDPLDPRPTIDREALAVLLRYPWPGNVRELQNEVRRASVLSDGQIGQADLSLRVQRGAGPRQPEGNSLAAAVAATEREAIVHALKATGCSVTVADILS